MTDFDGSVPVIPTRTDGKKDEVIILKKQRDDKWHAAYYTAPSGNCLQVYGVNSRDLEKQLEKSLNFHFGIGNWTVKP